MQRFLQIALQMLRLLRPAPGVFLFFIAPLVGALRSASSICSRVAYANVSKSSKGNKAL
ncbi:MAG: hypothetical protein NVS2B2_35220 [Ktedonobacteraceae bacterium]